MKALKLMLMAGLFGSLALPASADPWKDESGHGRYHDRKGPPPHARGGPHWDRGHSDRGHYGHEGKHRSADPYWQVSIDLGGLLGGDHGSYEEADGYYAYGGSRLERGFEAGEPRTRCYEEKYDAHGSKYRLELEPWECGN